MPSNLVYLLRLSISLAVVWLFYQLFLRRLTFYTMNRWYLLGYSVLSFFIPLINIYPILRDEGSAGEPYLIQFIPVVGDQGRVIAAEAHSGISGWALLAWAFALGTLALLIRSAIRGLSLYRLRKSARLIEGTLVRIYQVDASIIPFSFGNSIYINQHLHTEQEWTDIILHEYVHIRQRHTVDILLSELICMLNWYNPFCWLIRRSIRQNLEFIADQQVLGSGVDRKGYQYHLLKVIGEPRYRLANNFNFSSLKKRIVMMNKIRSARLHLLKFLFVLPLAGVLLVAFRDKYTGLWRPWAGGGYVNAAGIVISLPNKAPLARVVARGKTTGLETTGKARGKGLVSAAGMGSATADTHRKDTVPASGGMVQFLPSDILYVVDGEKMPVGWKPDKMAAGSIGSRVYVDVAKALTYFGPRGNKGAVVIRTKAYEEAHPFMVIGDDKRGNPAVLFGDSVLGRQVPLYVVDGRIWSNDSLQALNTDDILSIDVYKRGNEHTKQYGEQGKNGVIEITLKQKGAGAVKNRPSSLTINGISHVEGNGMAYGVANGPREGQALVTFDNGKQIAIADTIKMNGLIITTYHPGGK